MPLDYALGLSVLFALLGAHAIEVGMRVVRLEKMAKVLRGRITALEEKQSGPDGTGASDGDSAADG